MSSSTSPPWSTVSEAIADVSGARDSRGVMAIPSRNGCQSSHFVWTAYSDTRLDSRRATIAVHNLSGPARRAQSAMPPCPSVGPSEIVSASASRGRNRSSRCRRTGHSWGTTPKRAVPRRTWGLGRIENIRFGQLAGQARCAGKDRGDAPRHHGRSPRRPLRIHTHRARSCRHQLGRRPRDQVYRRRPRRFRHPDIAPRYGWLRSVRFRIRRGRAGLRGIAGYPSAVVGRNR